jgi:hypothetical protein
MTLPPDRKLDSRRRRKCGSTERHPETETGFRISRQQPETETTDHGEKQRHAGGQFHKHFIRVTYSCGQISSLSEMIFHKNLKRKFNIKLIFVI